MEKGIYGNQTVESILQLEEEEFENSCRKIKEILECVRRNEQELRSKLNSAPPKS